MESHKVDSIAVRRLRRIVRNLTDEQLAAIIELAMEEIRERDPSAPKYRGILSLEARERMDSKPPEVGGQPFQIT